jgi:hypothetical protein
MTGLVGVMRPTRLSQSGMGGRISTEEVSTMTEGTPGGTKTLGIKLPDELHAQLVLIATLEKLSLTDAIRQAIDYYIERKRGEGDLAARAAQAAEEIEREAAMRRQALNALFGPSQPPAVTEPPKPSSRRGREQTP